MSGKEESKKTVQKEESTEKGLPERVSTLETKTATIEAKLPTFASDREFQILKSSVESLVNQDVIHDGRLAANETKCSDLVAQFASVETKITDLATRMTAAETKLSAPPAPVAAPAPVQQATQKPEVFVALESRVKQTEDRLSSLENQDVIHDGRLETTEKSVEKVKTTDIPALEQSIENVNALIRNLTSQLTALTQKCRILEETNERLNKQLNEVVSSVNTNMEVLNSNISVVDAKLNAIRS